MTMAPITEDQVLNALPRPVADLCRELRGRYDHVPLGALVSAGLTTIGAAFHELSFL